MYQWNCYTEILVRIILENLIDEYNYYIIILKIIILNYNPMNVFMEVKV